MLLSIEQRGQDMATIGQQIEVLGIGCLSGGTARIQGISPNGKRLTVMFPNGALREIGSHEIART